MAEFSAADVAALRKTTGAGMMDCKHALTDADGDTEAARDLLRTKGLAGASKRAGRSAQQGAVEVVVDRDAGVGALVELTCETDFVAKGSDFAELLGGLAQHVVDHGADDLADAAYEGTTVSGAISVLGAKLGENIALGRVHRFDSDDGLLDGYQHVQNERGTIGVLVELGGLDRDEPEAMAAAHDVALHVASAAPRWLTRDEVPADVVEHERAVLEELTRNEGKPEPALERIVEGRLGAFFKDSVLLEQPSVRDPKQTIAARLATIGADATVRRFVRARVGED